MGSRAGKIGHYTHYYIFGWNDEVKVYKTAGEPLKPRKESMIFGRQTGNITGKAVENAASGDRGAFRVWRHDTENFKKLRHAAGQEIGTT